jgi:phospholipid-binding lipoprotein MlaA
LQPINRVFYALTQPIDRYAIRPVAIAYKTVVPHPLRDGVRNAIQNLQEPVVILNDILQLHPGRAIKGIVRMAINSTLGLGGLFDAARRKPFHIPHHENGFGDTLGYYGMPPLIYLYLPVLGPTTLRDTAGDVGDDFSRPRLLYKITHPDSDRPLWKGATRMGNVGTTIMVVDGIDDRAENDQELESIRKDSVDPYAALRSAYLQDRAGEIAALHARDGADAKNPHLDDPLTDPAAGK